MSVSIVDSLRFTDFVSFLENNSHDTSSKDAIRWRPLLLIIRVEVIATTSCNKKLHVARSNHMMGEKKQLGAPGIATRGKDAIRGSWPYY